MRFLHTGDLHLDGAFCSVGAIESAACRERQREVLKRIFALATEKECDMVLIAGDLFDNVFVSAETEAACVKLFSEFGKPIIISPGNHDPYVKGGFYARGALPANVFVFNAPELQYFDFPELSVSVAGYAFTSSAMLRTPLEDVGRPRTASEDILLLCAHADVNVPTSRYAPVVEAQIAAHGFDYAAFGHVHNPSQDYLGGSARYCGFAEGRAFDELGEGGVYVVDVDEEHRISVCRHVVSSVRYELDELSLDGAAEPEEIAALIERCVGEISDGVNVHLRLELIGDVCAESMPDLRALEGRLGERLASLELIDSTLDLPDSAYLEKDVTLRGEFYRALHSKLFSEDANERALALKALRIGLAAIDGKDFTDKGGRS